MLRVILGLCVVVLMTLLLSSVAVAASDDDALGQGLLDPFALTTIDVAPAMSSSSFSMAALSSPRPAVRIPFRPSLRSPFRPPLILR